MHLLRFLETSKQQNEINKILTFHCTSVTLFNQKEEEEAVGTEGGHRGQLISSGTFLSRQNR